MDNRELLLNTALELFHAKGYDAVGVQEIVDRAGVTKPTLYYYFGSKLGLLKSLLESRYNILEAKIMEASKTPGNLPQVLYQVAREFFDFAASQEKFYLFMLALFYSGRENEAFQAVSPLIERHYQLIVSIFEHFSRELGNMRGRQRLFAVGFTGVLNHHIMMVSYGLSENEKFEISNETTYEIVHQFLYGIYT
nr:helix-turn-helix domain-containing protein [uncultured Blautia sp.]